MSDRDRCRDCDKPMASDADISRCDCDDGCTVCEALCWRRYHQSCPTPIDWRAKCDAVTSALAAMQAERDEERANARQAVHVVRSSIVAYLRQKAAHSVVNGRVLLNLADDLEDFEHTTFVEKLIAERDEARACAALEAQHHAHLRKERDEARAALARYLSVRTLAAWHEDHGDVLWWMLPVCEPPYCGTPLDDDWPFEDDERPVWTEFVIPASIDSAIAQRSGK